MEKTVYHSSQPGLSLIIFALCSTKPQTSPGIGLSPVYSTLSHGSKQIFYDLSISTHLFQLWLWFCQRKKTHDNNNFSSWHSDCCIALHWLISYLSALLPCSNLISFWALPGISDRIICFCCLFTSFFHTSMMHTRDFWALTPTLVTTLNNNYQQWKWKLFLIVLYYHHWRPTSEFGK